MRGIAQKTTHELLLALRGQLATLKHYGGEIGDSFLLLAAIEDIIANGEIRKERLPLLTRLGSESKETV